MAKMADKVFSSGAPASQKNTAATSWWMQQPGGQRYLSNHPEVNPETLMGNRTKRNSDMREGL